MAWKDAIINFAVHYGFQLIGAAVILGIGLLAAMWLGRLLDAGLKRQHMHEPMRLLFKRLVRLLVFGLAAMLALDKFGVQIAPLIAGIGVIGVGIGLAAQGVLSNAVAGLTIIFSKPFLVDDYVQVLGEDGQVNKIELFTTTLVCADDSRVLIPNRKIVGEIIHNWGTKRQLKLTVGVAYGTDLKLAFATIRRILDANPHVLKEPTPAIGIDSLGDFSVNIIIRPWAHNANRGIAQRELYEAILTEFAAADIQIPFPMREVRLLNGAEDPAEAAIADRSAAQLQG